MKRLLVLAATLALAVAVLRGARAEEPSHPAGVPCAGCHTDVHAGSARGACGACHGTEAWLPSTYTAERHATAFALTGSHAVASCTGCHTGHRLAGVPTACAGCHVDRHRGLLGDACTACHTPDGFTPVTGFDHARSGFPIVGHHAGVACATCHAGAHGDALAMGAGSACTSCHTPAHGDLGACADCHVDAHATFVAARGPDGFDHRTTGFALHRRHASQACASCHPVGGDRPVARCASCHVDPHAGQLGTSCEDCHREDRWRLARFDHDLAGWPLRGRHFVTPCADCHTSQRWVGLPTGCWDCHAADAASAPRTVAAHGFGRAECQDCHGQWSW